ncbi:MAG: tetratricopeptide repeat protein, partial [Spirochaetes bacterium]|nr:tetratricopeptide repeat protein [Spirochaetota bacterium]
QYYHDKFGHYTIEIEPAVFLKKYGFPINDNNLMKSISHYNSGRINDALNQVDIALKKHPDSISTKLYLAEIYFSISDFDRAVKVYDEVLMQKNDDPLIYIKRAKCFEMKGDFRQAEKIYLELIDKWNDDYDLNIALISLYMIKFDIYNSLNYPLAQRNKVKKEIVRLCQKSIDLEPENLLGYFQMGRFYLKINDQEEALKYLKTAYKLENKKNYRGFFDFNEQPARYLALCYESMGQLDKAIEVLLPLSRQYDNPVILKYLANLHGYRGDIPNAEAMLNKAEVIESKQFISGYRQNYRLITGTILERGCKMIAMEHPLRSIDSLKKILEDIEAVIFVSNEFNFKKALEKESYNSFFIDMYAGDFGHCTERGNMLIVENLMNNILDEVK